MADVRLVLTTVGVYEKAEDLARALVERRLAACVNIVGPMRSIYRWQGKVEDQQEYLLLIKTTSDHMAELAAAFADLHPYELPERVEIGVAGGSAAYLTWIADQVGRNHQ